MGLDVYVGSLTRYYCGDWETVVQRYAREQGMRCEIVRPGAAPDQPRPSPQQVSSLVTAWRDELNRRLAEDLSRPLAWNESHEGPYFTDKPAWDCWTAMQLLAAHADVADIPCPPTVPQDCRQDEAWRRLAERSFADSHYPHVLLPEMWLPCQFDFIFACPDLTGREVCIGSSVALLEQLQELNEATLAGSPSQLAEWRRQGAEFGGPFDQAARFGLAIALDLAGKSVENHLPMKLDY